ncbi:gliding motility protein GldN [Dysgonomonas sp. Marseille-P4361]|uniref:gliding motility protein GldN n=1 Tax=Dysgonomonas sp. Marseille-P4361 TaxID=2161820 RepID=UPI000D55E056|nr:gliding motility protein GldN [Dysgonomonas sp. Marseille-P4361]
MKYIVSFMLSGLFFCSSLIAQDNIIKEKVVDQVDVVSYEIEAVVASPSTREFSIIESFKNDFSTSTWSKDIYRQIGKDTYGNDSFFLPIKTNERDVNLFTLLVDLMSANKTPIYKFNPQPILDSENRLEGAEALKECAIPFTVNTDGTYAVKRSDIPSEDITYYLVKEKWHFDSKTSKGEARVTHICPVLFERGKYFPLFWISMDDISAYLSRSETLVSFKNVLPALTNASMSDIINNRYYRGCIYQVGLRQLSHHFTDMQELINERIRIENELDYIQSRFYTAQNRR